MGLLMVVLYYGIPILGAIAAAYLVYGICLAAYFLATRRGTPARRTP